MILIIELKRRGQLLEDFPEKDIIK